MKAVMLQPAVRQFCPINYIWQRCTTFFGPRAAKRYFLVHSRAEDKIISCTFESRVQKRPNLFYLTSPFIACGLILLPSELFRIVISCKIGNSSMKFKFIHKIFVLQENFNVFLTCLEGWMLGGRIGLCIPDIWNYLQWHIEFKILLLVHDYCLVSCAPSCVHICIYKYICDPPRQK